MAPATHRQALHSCCSCNARCRAPDCLEHIGRPPERQTDPVVLTVAEAADAAGAHGRRGGAGSAVKDVDFGLPRDHSTSPHHDDLYADVLKVAAGGTGHRCAEFRPSDAAPQQHPCHWNSSSSHQIANGAPAPAAPGWCRACRDTAQRAERGQQQRPPEQARLAYRPLPVNIASRASEVLQDQHAQRGRSSVASSIRRTRYTV